MNAKGNIKKLKTNPKIRVFLFFLILSTIYWFFTSLSEKYIYLTEYKINYKNIPDELILQKKPISRIQAQIETSGFEIVNHKLKLKSLIVDISEFRSKDNYKHYFLLNDQIHTIQKQINNSKLIRFSQDSLLIYLGRLKTKKVPIIPDIHLSFKPGYKLTKDIEILPDSIQIKGPEKYIDSIESIRTEVKEFASIDKSFEFDLALINEHEDISKLSFETTEVKISGKVSKFTEGKMEVKITLPNTPDGIQLELFPKTASVKYKVAFDKYQKINTNSFSVTCDFPADHLPNKKTLKLYLSKKPDFIKDITIEPQQVSFLIQHVNSQIQNKK